MWKMSMGYPPKLEFRRLSVLLMRTEPIQMQHLPMYLQGQQLINYKNILFSKGIIL